MNEEKYADRPDFDKTLQSGHREAYSAAVWADIGYAWQESLIAFVKERGLLKPPQDWVAIQELINEKGKALFNLMESGMWRNSISDTEWAEMVKPVKEVLDVGVRNRVPGARLYGAIMGIQEYGGRPDEDGQDEYGKWKDEYLTEALPEIGLA